MKYKCKQFTIFLLMILLAISLMGCSQETDKPASEQPDKQVNEVSGTLKDGTYNGKSDGYGGELSLEVIVKDQKIDVINILNHNESSPVFSRAEVVIKDRILEAQTPVVDSVSGATFTSFAVKSAVSKALIDAGKDFGKIAFVTETEKAEPKELQDVETQLIIVGGGPAGLSAAISAKESGLSNVILIEKLDILGGNGKFDMNFYDMINSKAQKDIGINLTVEDFIEMKKNTVDSDARVAVWANGSYEVDQWFRDIGIELNYAYGKTNHMAEADEYAGERILNNLEKKAIELSIDIRTGTKGLDLIMENEKAVGVKVENKEGYYNIKSDAVIIATGGFASNKDLLKKHAPGAEIVQTSNQIGTTGDFVEVLENHDVKFTNMEKLNVFQFIIKKSRDLTGGGDDFILVNENGERFVTEKGRGLLFANIILEQPGKKAFYIYDQSAYESAFRLQKHVKLGYHTKADTLEELAEKLGINKDNLSNTVKTYNSAINGDIKDPFRGEDVFDRKFSENGPYYGVAVESAIHMTMGGVVANEKAQILKNSDMPIEGLYAAGEVTDVSGAFNAAVVFGRISGQEASKYILGK